MRLLCDPQASPIPPWSSFPCCVFLAFLNPPPPLQDDEEVEHIYGLFLDLLQQGHASVTQPEVMQKILHVFLSSINTPLIPKEEEFSARVVQAIKHIQSQISAEQAQAVWQSFDEKRHHEIAEVLQ